MRDKFRRGGVLFIAAVGGWDVAHIIEVVGQDRAGLAVFWTLIALFQFWMAWNLSSDDSER